MRIRLNKAERGLSGEMTVPPTSPSRTGSLIFGVLTDGTTYVQNFLQSKDCRSTMRRLQALGVVFDEQGSDVRITGKGLNGLTEAADILDAGTLHHHPAAHGAAVRTPVLLLLHRRRVAARTAHGACGGAAAPDGCANFRPRRWQSMRRWVSTAAL